ncbi:MAG: hypothetical protein ACRD2B_00455 [Terriglobia bacterium]
MAEQRLLQLTQDLKRLGTEECYFVQQPPGAAIESFLEKQREVLITADKLIKELAGEVRFNPQRLLGIEYPLDSEIDSISQLLEGLEDIKEAAVDAVEDLPVKTHIFAELLDGHLAGRMLSRS